MDRKMKEDLEKRLEGEGKVLRVLKGMNKDGAKTDWDGFRVQANIWDVLDDLMLRNYKFRVVMLGADNSVLAEFRRDLWCEDSQFYYTHGHFPGNADGGYWVAPFPFEGGGNFFPTIRYQLLVDVELSKLRDVVKCAAYIEEAK